MLVCGKRGGRGEGEQLTGDVADGLLDNADVTGLEPGGGLLAEDEVGGAQDERVGVELVANVGQDRVLEAGEGAPVVAAVGVGAQGDGLAALAVGVVDVDVVELEVGRLDSERGRLVVGQAVRLAQALRYGGLVARVAGRVVRLAVDGQLRGALADEDLLVVGPRGEEDALGIARARVEGVHGLLDAGEVAAAP